MTIMRRKFFKKLGLKNNKNTLDKLFKYYFEEHSNISKFKIKDYYDPLNAPNSKFISLNNQYFKLVFSVKKFR